MKNKKRTKYILWSILFVFTILLLWIFRPPSSYDKSRIDKRLTSLEEPFKTVETSYYLDGGSVGIKIVDKNNNLLKIALPVVDLGDPSSGKIIHSYEKVYFGACYVDDLEEGSVEVENPVDTILMLQDILHRYSNGDKYLLQALFVIRGRAIDCIRLILCDKNKKLEEEI